MDAPFVLIGDNVGGRGIFACLSSSPPAVQTGEVESAHVLGAVSKFACTRQLSQILRPLCYLLQWVQVQAPPPPLPQQVRVQVQALAQQLLALAPPLD